MGKARGGCWQFTDAGARRLSVEAQTYEVSPARHQPRSIRPVARTNSNAHVEIRDDGRGGATPDGGSGLRGLADRVGALDGQPTIESTPEGGTRIIAEIPCAS
jgi:hypothetical protein